MMKKFLVCISALGMLLILGCQQTTGDPRQGGLFGWSEDKAVERQNVLKDTKYEEERKAEESKSESARLVSERASLQVELDRQRRLVAEIDSELNALSKKISSIEKKKTKKQKELKIAKKELGRLNTEITSIKKNSQLSVQAKQQKLDALNKDVANLLELAAAL
jgi:chromosome segregation ATPase